MNVKQNLKYRETHKAIMDALLELLQTKNIKQVTVSELCRRVNINRSTFYEHFLDVSDVLEKIVEELTAEAADTFTPGKEPRREDLLRLFEHIQRHRDFFSLYFKQGLPMDIQERFFHRSPPHDPPREMTERGFTALQLEYGGAMASAAFDAMIRHWLERGCIETPEQLCDILEVMVQEKNDNA